MMITTVSLVGDTTFGVSRPSKFTAANYKRILQ